MKTIRAYIKRHPVLAYYALVFTISWGRYSLRGRGWSWRTPGYQGTGRDTIPHRAPGAVRRPQRGGPRVDRPRIWEGWLS